MSKYNNIKLDFSNIPRKNNQFSWINSIGSIIPYTIEHTNYSGRLIITDFVKPYTVIFKIDDEMEEYSTNTISIVNGHIHKVFGIKARHFKYDIGEIILNHGLILDQILINKKGKTCDTKVVGYKIKCLNDNYEYDIEEAVLNISLKNGTIGCPVCSSKVIIPNINSLAALLPGIEDWFSDKTIPYSIPRFSNTVFDLICPYCGTKKQISPFHLSTLPSCICQDGFSYPEKLFGALLNQLNIEYIYQLSRNHFDWCDKYKFDFYFKINNIPYIVELDGGLGHNHRIIGNNKNNDIIKNNIAQFNNVELFRIDVNYSDISTRFEYVKKNIISSLNSIICFDNINWNDVELNAEKSILHKIIDIYNHSPNKLPNDIASEVHVSSSTVRQYLKKGSKLGLCNYSPEESQKKYIEKVQKSDDIVHKGFVLLKVEKDGFYHIHKTIADFARKSESILGFKISQRQILRTLNNPSIKNKHNVTFSYATKEEYKKYITYKNAE